MPEYDVIVVLEKAPPELRGGNTRYFGGVKINDRAQVLDTSWEPMPGLYACGEMVGGLFHVNLSRRHRPDVGRGVRSPRRGQRRGGVR